MVQARGFTSRMFPLAHMTASRTSDTVAVNATRLRGGLKRTLFVGGPIPSLVHHSDRGTQLSLDALHRAPRRCRHAGTVQN
jgi:hypothetical protein